MKEFLNKAIKEFGFKLHYSNVITLFTHIDVLKILQSYKKTLLNQLIQDISELKTYDKESVLDLIKDTLEQSGR